MKRIWTPTPEHYKAMNWCINNDIKIFPKPFNGVYYFIYTIEGQGHRGRKTYTKQDLQVNQWNFYLYLYEKYKDV